MKEFFTSLFERIGFAFWLKVTTEQPECTYYFGPFLSREEAISSQQGFLDDLAAEGAENIRVNLKRCPTPEELTVFDESTVKKNLIPAFS